MAVADGSTTTLDALGLASAVVVLVTAVVNGVVAMRTARQGEATRKAVIDSTEANDQALSGFATSIVELSRTIDQRFTTAQDQMTTLLDVLRDLVDRVSPPSGSAP